MSSPWRRTPVALAGIARLAAIEGGGTPLQRRAIFDPIAVQHLVQDDLAGRVDCARTIFALMTLELWCLRFVSA
jgi:hypothetical protein